MFFDTLNYRSIESQLKPIIININVFISLSANIENKPPTIRRFIQKPTSPSDGILGVFPGRDP